MKRVNIADLKARLSRHLRDVRRGHDITVMDRRTPVARIVPYPSDTEALVVRRPLNRRRRLHAVPLPPPLKLRTDVVALLLKERQVGR